MMFLYCRHRKRVVATLLFIAVLFVCVVGFKRRHTASGGSVRNTTHANKLKNEFEHIDLNSIADEINRFIAIRNNLDNENNWKSTLKKYQEWKNSSRMLEHINGTTISSTTNDAKSERIKQENRRKKILMVKISELQDLLAKKNMHLDQNKNTRIMKLEMHN